ncbi:MAG: O-antigen ligase family protein [Clostridiales bacterium]|nr:O-antigen ligase family protein [Clostridiales bacterium]
MVKQTGIHVYSYVIALYYMFAPLEDFLTGSAGTVARYLALLIVFAALIESRGKIYYKSSMVNRCIIWMMMLSVLSILWAVDKRTALSRNMAYILVPGITLFVGLLPFEKKDYELIVKAATLGGAITILFLLATGRFNLMSNSYYRLQLTENNDPNNFAALLMLPLALCFRRKKSKRLIILLYRTGLAVALMITILYTGSRGALVSLAVAAFAYLLWIKAYKNIGYIVVCGILILFFAWYILPQLSTDLLARLDYEKTVADMVEKEGQRGAIWKHVFYDLIPNTPPWGIGAGCGPVALKSIYGKLKGVHNTYLNMLLEFGILGLPIFFWMLFSLLRDEYKNKRYLEAALLISICSIIFFLDSYAKKFFWNVVMLLLINESVVACRENAM